MVKPDIRIFECSSCGAQHNTGSGDLPLGWSSIPRQGLVWCTDCTVASQPARHLQQRRSRKAA